MKNLTLYQIAKICGGTLGNCSAAAGEIEISGVVLDSRKVQENFLFLATKGERTDGHQFITQVMQQGAAGVVCEQEPEHKNIPYILVKDSFAALKAIATFYRQQLDVKVVGITGSVGKTSTKEFIAGVLAEKYTVLKTQGNFNNEIGLPLTILQIQKEHEVAVLEMGISDFGEMHRLSEMAKPDICVITNIGHCHLEKLKSRKGILQAKTEIFDFMPVGAVACVNGDDDMLRTISQINGIKPIWYGLGQTNEFYADAIVGNGLFGSKVQLHLANGLIQKNQIDGTIYRTEPDLMSVSIPLPGIHMVYNALAAACVGAEMGLTGEQIVAGIEGVGPVSGRSNIIQTHQWVVIDDCYNANPASVCAAIELLCMANTRKVAVLGDMFELGENSHSLHEDMGRFAMESEVDVLICIGILSKHIYEGARAAMKHTGVEHIYHFDSMDGFISCKDVILNGGDTILVKASHGMHFYQLVNILTN